MTLKGHIDRLTPEGLLEGWCWDEANPGRRIEVVVLVDGVEVCSGIAGIFRADILEAGIGDGFHAFKIFLPWTDPRARRSRTITLRDTLTGGLIENKLVHHDRGAIDLDERLYELEAQARQIETRLSDVSELLQRANAAGDLFAVVGTFFTQLADDARRGQPLTTMLRLNSVVETVMSAHPILTLAPGAAPRVTICVEGDAPLAILHACIEALLRAGAEQSAEIVLFDAGRFDDVAILPTVVRGLRYCRVVNPAVAEWNEAARASTAEMMVFLSGHAGVEPDWLAEMLEALRRSPTLGALGGCVVDADGLPVHGGMVWQEDGQLRDCGARADAVDPDYLCARPVHLLSHHAIAIRREALAACGYFNERCATPADAVMDLCQRLALASWHVRYLPSARLRWLTGAGGPGPWSPARRGSANGHGDELGRWPGPGSAGAPPALQIGVAALIGSPDDPEAQLLAAAQQLQDLGYAVRYLGPVAEQSALARQLRRCGAQPVPCETQAELRAALDAIGPDLIHYAAEPGPIANRPIASRPAATAAVQGGAVAPGPVVLTPIAGVTAAEQPS